MNTKSKKFTWSGLAYALVLILLATTMVGIVAYAAGSKTHNIGGNVTFSADGVEATVEATNWEELEIGTDSYTPVSYTTWSAESTHTVLQKITYSTDSSTVSATTAAAATWTGLAVDITDTTYGNGTLTFTITNTADAALYTAVSVSESADSGVTITVDKATATLGAADSGSDSTTYTITFAVNDPDYDVTKYGFSIEVTLSTTEISGGTSASSLEVYANSEAIKGYSVNMGEYPQTIASDLTTSTNGVEATGEYFDEDETLPIYTYNGDRYVCASASYYSSSYGTDGTYFFKIEPIVWDVIAFYDTNDLDGNAETEIISDVATYGSQLTDEQVIVLSHSGLEAMAFDSSAWGWGTGTDIYDWLNNTFYNSAFTSDEQSYIASHDDSETEGTTSVEEWTVYSSISGVTSKVWLLSITEVDSWFTYDSSTYYSDLICYNTDYSLATGAYRYNDGTGSACYWWLRSCGDDYDGDCAYCVSDGGYLVDTDGVGITFYVARPALLINL